MKNQEFLEILKAINGIRDDISILREEVRDEKNKNEKRWKENEIRWKQNEKRWQENKKMWEENEKRWQENKKMWDENQKKWKENNLILQDMIVQRKNDIKHINEILWSFQTSVEKMYNENKSKIIKIEKSCIKCNYK